MKISEIYKSKIHVRALKALFVIYMLFMIWELYLGNYRSHGYVSYNLMPFKTIIRYLSNMHHYNTWIVMVNVVGNIAVFIPMGFFISFFLRGRIGLVKVVLVSIAVLLPVEILQILFKVGSFDIDDIILNILGSVLGYAAYKAFKLVVAGYMNRKGHLEVNRTWTK